MSRAENRDSGFLSGPPRSAGFVFRSLFPTTSIEGLSIFIHRDSGDMDANMGVI